MVDSVIAGSENDLNLKTVHSTLADADNFTTMDTTEQRLQQAVNLGASRIRAAVRAWNCARSPPDDEGGPCRIIHRVDEWWRENIALEVVSTDTNFLMCISIFNWSY